MDELQSQRNATTNQRMYIRNLPSDIIQSYVDFRPSQTRYHVMPIQTHSCSPHPPPHPPLGVAPTFDTTRTFIPSTRKAPFSGFARNVDLESELRNQVYALQRSSQAVYVPQSTSNLYSYSHKTTPTSVSTSFLQSTDVFSKFNPNTENVGKLPFQNCTRQQLMDVHD